MQIKSATRPVSCLRSGSAQLQEDRGDHGERESELESSLTALKTASTSRYRSFSRTTAFVAHPGLFLMCRHVELVGLAGQRL